MKVKLSRDTCNRIKLTTKQRKNIVELSIFEADAVNLKSNYLHSYDLQYAPLSYYIEAGISVTWEKNRNKVIDLLKERNEEESSIAAYSNSIATCITTYIRRDTKAFVLDLIAYHITK
jgi:hypothetical protein